MTGDNSPELVAFGDTWKPESHQRHCDLAAGELTAVAGGCPELYLGGARASGTRRPELIMKLLLGKS